MYAKFNAMDCEKYNYVFLFSLNGPNSYVFVSESKLYKFSSKCSDMIGQCDKFELVKPLWYHKTGSELKPQRL